MGKRDQKKPKKALVSQHASPELTQSVNEEERYAKIGETAYFLAEQRGFQGDSALDDWLHAEAEINAHPLAVE